VGKIKNPKRLPDGRFGDLWTQKEVVILKGKWKEKGKEICSLLPNRTFGAIKRMASRLQLKRREVQVLPPPDLDESQKGYLAAIIDGEGTISINTGSRPFRQHHPIVYITNTSLGLLQYIKKLLGGGNIKPHQNATAKRRASWRWRLSGYSNIKMLLEQILPYLFVKKRVAELVIEYTISRLQRGAKWGHHLGLTEREQEIIMEVKVLNSHGRSETK